MTDEPSAFGELSALAELADAILGDLSTFERICAAEASGGLDRDLWSALDQAGITALSVPESASGSGGGLPEAGTLLRAAGRFAAAAPIAEHALLAGWLLASAGLRLPGGIATAAAGDAVLTSRTGTWRAQGTLTRVPWASVAETVAVLAGDGARDYVLAIPVADCVVRPGTNVAGEPRDDLVLDVALSPDDVVQVADGLRPELELRGALGRSLLIAGAAERALAMTVQYCGERTQFGRPIGSFQAVQQQVALLAGEAVAAQAAAEAAVLTCDRLGFGAPETFWAVGSAKARTSEAAAVAAKIAHQVHGALGFTLEHPLRLLTTRLWAWRDEYGGEAYWQERLGARACVLGAAGSWQAITAS
jgi:acyl-CoA dehydrogenase